MAYIGMLTRADDDHVLVMRCTVTPRIRSAVRRSRSCSWPIPNVLDGKYQCACNRTIGAVARRSLYVECLVSEMCQEQVRVARSQAICAAKLRSVSRSVLRALRMSSIVAFADDLGFRWCMQVQYQGAIPFPTIVLPMGLLDDLNPGSRDFNSLAHLGIPHNELQELPNDQVAEESGGKPKLPQGSRLPPRQDCEAALPRGGDWDKQPLESARVVAWQFKVSLIATPMEL
jgi:hypothetical protein